MKSRTFSTLLQCVKFSVFAFSLGIIPTVSLAVPLQSLASATTMVNSQCGFDSSAPADSKFGTSNMNLPCDASGSGYVWVSGVTVGMNWQASANTYTSLGNTGGSIGLVDISGSASATGPKASSLAAGGGTATIYFRITELAPAPIDISEIPLLFSANAEGYLKGDSWLLYGSYSAYARMGYGDTWQGFSFVHRDQVAGSSDSFSGSKTISLTTAPDAVFRLFVSADCEATAHGGYVGVPLHGGYATTGWAECSSVVDPWLSFDQGAFDALQGPDSFRLSDYFGLEYSANVPTSPAAVPEPSAFSLIGLALVAAWGTISFQHAGNQPVRIQSKLPIMTTPQTVLIGMGDERPTGIASPNSHSRSLAVAWGRSEAVATDPPRSKSKA